jgi:type I restriction enzyme S subunit
MEKISEDGRLCLDETRRFENVVQGYTHFRNGDVIVAKITPCFENGKGALCEGLLNGLGFGTTELHVLRAGEDLDPMFAFYLTRSRPFRALGAAAMYGAAGQQRVPEEFLKDFPTTVPGLTEQRIISVFLDRETAKIDALIAKRQQLISLLEEKRAALISHVVTKGLDPSVPMKNSGIEWLGKIPAHWGLKRLKFLSSLQTGVTLGKDYEGCETVSRPYLRVANVQDGYLDLDEITEITIPLTEAQRYELRKGDVLMTEGGDFDKLGRGYVWDGQIDGCLHQNHIFAVRPTSNVLDSQYLSFLMTSAYGKAYFTSTSQQTTNLACTNSTKIKGFLLPVPPYAEQELLLRYVRTETSKLETLVGRVSEGIEQLHEFRMALISAAVTGKIDVRGEVQ